jgi:exopolysaccharide biosynthesis polyprenyl glycosylphosphotransferase
VTTGRPHLVSAALAALAVAFAAAALMIPPLAGATRACPAAPPSAGSAQHCAAVGGESQPGHETATYEHGTGFLGGAEFAILLLVGGLLSAIALGLQRLTTPNTSEARKMRSLPKYSETVLAARRQLRSAAFNIAPAVGAGALAGIRLESAGAGAIVAVMIVAVSVYTERRHLPLHLMPLASAVVRVMVPVVGMGLALATLFLAGHPVRVTGMLVPLVGAWLLTALAHWIMTRFEAARQVQVAIIGSPGLALGLEHEFSAAGIRGYTVVGWLADGGTPIGAGGAPRCLGSIEELRSVVERHSIELLVHSNGSWSPHEKPRQSRLELFDHVASACLDLPVRLLEATQLYENLLGHVPLGQANSAWFQYLLHPKFRAGSAALQRGFAVILAATMLVFLAPVLAIFAALVKLTDGGPIFYRQRRVGEKGREFEMIKLRSMRVDSEGVGARWSTSDDDRVTAVGRIMRRFHIDEMPQLWNVLRGEMTIVGPRPERPELIVQLERHLSYYDRRHLVKPGLAGWAQARCGYSGSEEGTGWKLCHDLYYLKHRSVYFDVLVLIENVRVSLRGGVQFGLAVPQQQFIVGG